MKIHLGRGYYTEIDFSDFYKTIGYNWCALVSDTNAYACAYPAGTNLLLHRHLLMPPSDMQVDHIDGNGLNNRRANLRLATASQNRVNQDYAVGVSGYRGVTPNGNRWRARVTCRGVEHHIGTFDTIEEAAEAYNVKAKALFGLFARLNIIG